MKSPDEKIKSVENALKAAYREKSGHDESPAWEKRVMTHVRTLNAAPDRVENVWYTPGMWRAAAVCVMSALIIMAYSLTENIGPDYLAARLLLEEPLDLTYTQSLVP